MRHVAPGPHGRQPQLVSQPPEFLDLGCDEHFARAERQGRRHVEDPHLATSGGDRSFSMILTPTARPCDQGDDI